MRPAKERRLPEGSASTPEAPAEEARRPASSRRSIYLLLGAAALLGALLILWSGRPRAPREEALESGAPGSGGPGAPGRAGDRAPGGGDSAAEKYRQFKPQASGSGDPSDPAPDDPADARERRRKRAQHALDGYLEWAKYPPESRPLRDQPDQVHPHHVASNKLPLARADQKLTDAMVTLNQDRYFVTGDEEVVFTITCENSDGPAACEVLSSAAVTPPQAQSAGSAQQNGVRQPLPGAGLPPSAVPFEDGGIGADRAAGDGVLTGTLTPAAQGFAGYHGPIRVELELRIEGESGRASFDIEYTPSAPAMFTGEIREAIEDGSLCLYAAMDVKKAGRYVISARADDKSGRSFAYLSFNEELGEGRREAKLRIFGKLIRDEKAAAPFQLRDVEGFLLKENTYPDRELMPMLQGAVHTTKSYKDADFSNSEWQSEEKDRHVDELNKDVNGINEPADGKPTQTGQSP